VQNNELRKAARQEQFLDVISRDEATRRFHQHLSLAPLGSENVPLADALGRVLATETVADVDVSGFDRSNVDGFAVQAHDTAGAAEETPKTVRLNDEILSPGVQPGVTVQSETATTIATGGMVPRGADAVVMVEHTQLLGSTPSEIAAAGKKTGRAELVEISRSLSPGENITFAGTDISRGETVLRTGEVITSREIGVLAAIGTTEVQVFRRPRVAIISTGSELVAPGQPCPPGAVYDSNLAILSAAVQELGGEPVPLGIVVDDEEQLALQIEQGLACDAIVLSGGTSKGAGDVSYRVVQRLKDPGIVAHGVALKPGKPICLAVTGGKPVVILPGFPTSAIFTFHEFVAPVLRAFAGQPAARRESVSAKLAFRVNSDGGRTEYLLVGLVRASEGLAAYPMGKGSGSVTAFSKADGFITIPQQTEIVEAGSLVAVQLLSRSLEPADLVVIGSHCVGLDVLLGEMTKRGFTTKVMHVGSMGGLAAAQRGECDVAGIHLMHPETGKYNEPFLTSDLSLVSGYRRMQVLAYRSGDVRFENLSVSRAIESALDDPNCQMVNRNSGSGTRVLVDKLLKGRQPPGYAIQTRSHNAVATSISQQRSDWGVAIDTVARAYGLSYLPIQEEHFDFVVPKNRLDRPAVALFCELLADRDVQTELTGMGFRLPDS
jgi:putative molybdopterin biosynthesis protein